MSYRYDHKSRIFLKRITGGLFLASIVVPIAAYGMLSQNLFRMSVVLQVLSAIFSAVLGVCLFSLLKREGHKLARCGLVLKTVEAALIACVALAYFAILLISGGQSDAAVLASDTLVELANSHLQLTCILGLFLGGSMTLFSVLLAKSYLVPRIVALFGVISYSLVLLYDGMVIVAPYLASKTPIQVLGTAPVCLFTVTFSFWLFWGGTGKAESQERIR